MIASLLLAVEGLLGDSLVLAAGRLRALTFLLFAVAWLVPPIRAYMRRRRARRPLREVLYWLCVCGQANSFDTSLCSRCAATRPRGWNERFWVSPGGKILKGLGTGGRIAGWTLYYLLSLAAADAVDLWRAAPPLRTLFASAAALCALGSVVWAGRALRRRGGGPTDRLLALAGSIALAGFFAFSAALWAAAPYPPSKPLALIRLFPDGRILFDVPGGLKAEPRGILRDGAVELRVRSAFISWPLLQIRQTVPLAVNNESLAKSWLRKLLSEGARRLTSDTPQRPRVALREDVLFGRPGVSYVLRPAADGVGFVLIPAEPQAAAPRRNPAPRS
jgi:hypothetical protein